MALLSMVDYYNSLWDLRDRRVDAWPLLSSAVPTLLMSIVYIWLVTCLGPRLMEKRAAYNVKWLMTAYNVSQVLFSAYIVREALMGGWATTYSLFCQGVDLSSCGMRMAYANWLYYINKFVEFADTFFFVARKKMSQVTYLHIVHHSTMPILTFICVRWLPGGESSFGALLNSVIHVLMYSYYLVTALHILPVSWRRPLAIFKRNLTRMQILQFIVILIKCSMNIFGIVSCSYPWQGSAIMAGFIVTYLVLFVNFYFQSYETAKRVVKKQE